MNDLESLNVVSEIFFNIFQRENLYTLDELKEKFAFDVKLPRKVKDSLTGEETWTEMENAELYIKQKNMDRYDATRGWIINKRKISTLEDIINIWKKINYITTERIYDSDNVHKSDTIYNCSNIYHSTDCRGSKNILFSDGLAESENMIASQRTANSNNCIRVDDSGNCSNSYNVICSAKITNSFFIQDCNSLYECMFCSHISNRRYCIANMQFEKEEYLKIKKILIDWITKKE